MGQTATGEGSSPSFGLKHGFWQELGEADTSCCLDLTGNVDCDPEDLSDIGDLIRVIDYLFITFEPLCCKEETNIDGDPDCIIDISDLTWLIDYLFITFTLPEPCCGCCDE